MATLILAAGPLHGSLAAAVEIASDCGESRRDKGAFPKRESAIFHRAAAIRRI